MVELRITYYGGSAHKDQGFTVLATASLYRSRYAVLARMLGLPPARYGVLVERDIPVPMPDGVRLRTDHYYPAAPGSFPTVLIRTPYGGGLDAPGIQGQMIMFMARRFAERGYHVAVQTVRGRYDSEGVFEPQLHDPDDGRATMDWISRQTWFNGALGMWGMSYLGYMQWAAAPDAPAYLKALVPSFTAAEAFHRYHPNGAYGLLNSLSWVQTMISPQARTGRSLWAELQRMRQRQIIGLEKAFQYLPILEADVVAAGQPVHFYRDWLTHDQPDDPYWAARDYHQEVPRVTTPVHLIAGWYDMFLSSQLKDYAALRDAGRSPHLTVGPWTHVDLRGAMAALHEGLRWFEVHLRGDRSQLRAQPVRYYLMGAEEWREIEAWPPPATEHHYYLHSAAYLSPVQPTASSAPDRYRYDPADPTPSLAGPVLIPPAGPVDNRPLEARPDVLCYTTEPLVADLDVIGTPKVDLYVRSSLPHTDFFARLCDVQPDGQSINICDGLVRLEPGSGMPQADGSLRIELALWPTAQRFRRGHRLRMQISSGAHPRWSRNLGTGEPVATGTRILAAEQTVFHDREHPSAVVLPVGR